MGETGGTSWPPPGLLSLVEPGHLDARVLGQGTFWVSAEGAVLRLDQMPVEHLHSVAEMLRGRATGLHFWAVVDAIYAIRASARSDVPSGDVLEFALTGASIADVDARVWVAATPLMRAIGRLLAGLG